MKAVTLTKRLLCATLALACAALFTLAVDRAGADPVQEFNVQIKDIKADGRYALVFTTNSYDTNGKRPPIAKDGFFRFASGIRIRPEFLTKNYQCDVNAVRKALITPDGNRNYTQRLRDLAGTLRRTRSKLLPSTAKKVETCVRSQIGYGNVVADARPVFADPSPANLFIYLAKPAAKNAEVTFSVLVVLDEHGWLWKHAPLLRTFRLARPLNAYWQPSAGGRFAYRLVLPGDGAGGVRASIAEMKLTLSGLTQTKQTVKCLVRRSNRCVRSRLERKKLFWLTRPACPSSSVLRFASEVTYETGNKLTTSTDVPCPRFRA